MISNKHSIFTHRLMTHTEKRFFLLDGIGAFSSAIFLGIILVLCRQHIGLSSSTLYALAIPACLFVIYDMGCMLIKPRNWKPYLKAIAFMNFGYCLVSLIMVVKHWDSLTLLGLAYFTAEILIIFIIATLELKHANT